MSLSSIINIANSGLMTAQAQIRVSSDNVANVNTPGYVRKVADQTAATTGSIGAGVEIGRVRLATDRFLQAASLQSGAEAARQGVRYELYDRIQSLFGDPGGNAGFFSRIDGLFSAFAASAEDASSSPLRSDALMRAQSLFDESARITRQIHAVREDADSRIKTAVDSANMLLSQIESLNVEIARATVSGGDATGSQGAQIQLVNQLSSLMDINIAQRPQGGVSIRTGAGVLLAGAGHATLEYTRAGSVNGETAFADVYVTEPGGQKRSLADTLKSGEIRGLLELRDVEAPAAAERLGELMARVADELNRAHNQNTAVPAPGVLTGRNMGQGFGSALAGFQGTTTVAVTNAQGLIQARAEIVFAGGTMTVNDVAADPTTFLATLNAQLGGLATASFTDGRLSVEASGANGVAIGDDPADPARKNGKGFAHWFGLNDLVRSDRPVTYDTGLTPASAHGFAAGQSLTFRLGAEAGERLGDLTFTVPAGASMADLVTALNDPATGLGRHGAFTLNAQGQLSFAAAGSLPVKLSVLDDTTSQAHSGVSMTELFGLGGGVRASRADDFSIRADIRSNPSRLALAQLNLDAAGGSALSNGDGRGARLLADAIGDPVTFDGAGGAAGATMSLSRYASDLSGDVGARAANAKTRAEAAGALSQEARARQTGFEGVNLDEELVLLTTYQQAFNASARLIQAASEMYDTLLGMTR